MSCQLYSTLTCSCYLEYDFKLLFGLILSMQKGITWLIKTCISYPLRTVSLIIPYVLDMGDITVMATLSSLYAVMANKDALRHGFCVARQQISQSIFFCTIHLVTQRQQRICSCATYVWIFTKTCSYYVTAALSQTQIFIICRFNTCIPWYSRGH